jgi:hypothetical protein
VVNTRTWETALKGQSSLAYGSRLSTDEGKIRADFDVANAVFSQIGLSIVNSHDSRVLIYDGGSGESPAEVHLDELPSPLPTELHQLLLNNPDRAQPAVANVYYISQLEGGGWGLTIPPNGPYPIPGMAVVKDRGESTLAHELGHFLLGSPAAPGVAYRHEGDPTGNHSAENRNLMQPTVYEPPSYRRLPKYEMDNVIVSYGHETCNLDMYGQLNDEVYLDLDSDRDFDNGEPKTSQGQAIYLSTYIGNQTPNSAFAERADFYWIEDSWLLEGLDRADVRKGTDDLVWGIGTLAVPPQVTGVHQWSPSSLPLPIGRLNSTSFNYVDVVTNIARYGDLTEDVNGEYHWSLEDAALDYDLFVSPTGIAGSWTPVVSPETVFKKGFHEFSVADDYIARYKVEVYLDPGSTSFALRWQHADRRYYCGEPFQRESEGIQKGWRWHGSQRAS